jgi:carboxyl-terminal processing protease
VRIKQAVAPALLVVLFGALLVHLPLAIAARADQYDFFDPIVDVRDLLVRRFVEVPDQRSMQEAMIDGMIGTLDDPHTVWVAPREEREFEKGLRGTYVGIGAEVNLTEEGHLQIVSPMDGSPALEAGVMAGDVVVAIEGTSTLDLTLNDCIDKLLGEPGTPVTIRVRHLDGEEEDLEITRRRIVTVTVRGLLRLGEDWAYCIDEASDLSYVRVTQFNETTVRELSAVLQELSADGIGGLVLDLRDNPGGELGAAVGMADMFLSGGTIVSVRDRDGQGPAFTAHAPGTLPDFPMIVLVNEGSASASEIVSGALQENGRARVLGTRTHGKGSVQEVHELPMKRGTLKITSAYYYMPSGRNIHRRPESTVWGVDPDPGMLVAVSDEQYIEKLRARRDVEIIRAETEDQSTCHDADWIRERLKDEQLATATELLLTRVASGAWPEPDAEQNAASVALETELHRMLEARNRQLTTLNRIERRIGELRSMADEAGHQALLPEDVDLLAGSIMIRDRHGNVVGEYRIDGGNVEMALETMQLSPINE